ncbi:wall-associated receptor kinase-like 14 [Bidens hawaiensis]|uniref:wall-associated receptor kinase-like 14 n=1 Tax=Bidens hawaiensis TaxID=980011 RepID=UPI00404A72EB
MILHIHISFVILIIIITSPSSTSAQANCTRVCPGRANAVPYPFGFSDSCEIQLDCSAAGDIRIGGYSVQNITKDQILIILPAKCDRLYEEVGVFGTQNYAMSSRNGLLLEKCSSTLNDCAMSTSLFQNSFSLQQCDTGINITRISNTNTDRITIIGINNTDSFNNTSITNSTNSSSNGNNNSTVDNSTISCYSEDVSNNEELMNLTSLEQANCQILFSSINVDMNGSILTSMPPQLEFRSLELSWWVRGNCSCDQNASCRNVTKANQTIGYRCNCSEGYDGDGFINGDGCRRG